MKTKLLRYTAVAISQSESFKYKGYVFRYDKNKQAIPVRVLGEDAEFLLTLTDSPCACHNQKPKPLFKEV